MSGKLRRANVSDSVKMSLLCDVKGYCPLCGINLMRRKSSGKHVRQFDVAHIYPLNPTPHELLILKGEPLLSTDIDSEENFIPLCKPCHKTYDTGKTVEEYRQLYSIKLNIKKFEKLSEEWKGQQLLDDISIAVEAIKKTNTKNNSSQTLSYEALNLDEKTDDTFDSLTEMKVAHYITNFYPPIKQSLNQLEQEEKVRSSLIYNQVKGYYLRLLSKGFNQLEIFEHMCDWFMANKAVSERAKAEVLVSFFIQNCEVFS